LRCTHRGCKLNEAHAFLYRVFFDSTPSPFRNHSTFLTSILVFLLSAVPTSAMQAGGTGGGMETIAKKILHYMNVNHLLRTSTTHLCLHKVCG
jgi:hypothetical protein